MFERIFLNVEDFDSSQPAVELAFSLARRFGARLFAVCVIDTAKPGPDGNEDPSDIEEQAWKTLYEIEDDAFDAEISISLLLEQGDPLERLLDLAASYQPGLIIAPAKTRLSVPELVGRSPAPVIFATVPRRYDE